MIDTLSITFRWYVKTCPIPGILPINTKISKNEHGWLVATVPVNGSMRILEEILKKLVPLKGRHEIFELRVELSNTLLPRPSIYIKGHEDEHGYRKGLSGSNHRLLCIIQKCDPDNRTVVLESTPHGITDAERTYREIFDCFLEAVEDVCVLAHAAKSIADLVKALRTGDNPGYITRMIHEAFGRLSACAKA